MTGNGSSVQERILQAATDLMLARGLRKVTMEEIAATLGMSKKTLYQAYSSKDELVHAVAEREFASWTRKRRALVEEHAEVVDQLHALARYIVEAHRRFGPEIRRDLRAEYPDLWEELRHHQTRHNQAVEILIERGIGEGYLKAVNPRVAALALRGALGAVTQAGTVQANTFTADSAAQDVFELFLRGLLTESGATALEHVT